MSSGLPRDRASHDQLAPRLAAWRKCALRKGADAADDEELTHYRWMLEELRVSLFAQELGTSLPVSPQRVDKQLSKLT